MGQTYAGRYELVDLIGRGGMGDVWRAWDRRQNRYIAAKVLRQSDSAALLRFVRESSWRIDHPHIVMPTGWVGEDDLVLFAMPIVSGGSLATVIGDHGPVPWTWARAVLDQTLQALESVHAAGLVHRDVKPANILLQPTGTNPPFALLSDFGIAWHRDEPRLTRAAEMVGTPGYQAPELAQGAEPHPSHDLYSVGLVARALLGGTPHGTVLADLTDPDPARRPTTAGEVREALAQIFLEESATEPVEVFNQLPDWPDGWGPAGPTGADRADVERPVAAPPPSASTAVNLPPPPPPNAPAQSQPTKFDGAEPTRVAEPTKVVQANEEPPAGDDPAPTRNIEPPTKPNVVESPAPAGKSGHGKELAAAAFFAICGLALIAAAIFLL